MTLRIGVYPRAQYASHSRLFSCLELVFSVAFFGFDEGEHSDCAAVIQFLEPDDNGPDSSQVPTLVLPASDTGARRVRSTVKLAGNAALHPAIRGRVLTEDRLAIASSAQVEPNGSVFATANGTAIWGNDGAAAGRLCWSVLALDELAPGEHLRDRLRDGRFASLLPVVQFLKSAEAVNGWTGPPARAAFLIDDPNLHTSSYGYLRYKELAAHAKTHDYHLAMATIPLDGWFTSTGAVRIFRDAAAQLSLLIHGNNHVHHELTTFPSEAAALASLAQALRRIETLENRTGLTVSRIMAPPHGVCSEHAMSVMLKLGFDGICVSRPFPWLDAPPGDMPSAGWFPADMVAGGLPVIPRYHLSKPFDDLALRALLGQPIVLYGHHDDCRGGLNVLADAASHVHSLGNVRWCSLQEIASTNFDTRLDSNVLHIRSFSNNIKFMVPRGVESVVLSAPPIHAGQLPVSLAVNGKPPIDLCEYDVDRRTGFEFRVPPGPVSVSIIRGMTVDWQKVPEPPWKPWPILRRVMTQGRDRLRPALGR